MVELDPDAVVAALWHEYRETISATVLAKHSYISLSRRTDSPRREVQEALADWKALVARKRNLARRLALLEEHQSG